MSAPDLAAQLGMTRQTIHRLLQQLEEIGMVRRDLERERFEIGAGLAELGLHALTGNHTARFRRAVMEKLVAMIGESCKLAVLNGHETISIDDAECDWPLRGQCEIGYRMPAYCTAIGKVLLAHLPARTLEQYLSKVTLEPLTENTWTDPALFRKHLEKIRQRGYAINNQENFTGLLAVAVPVREPSGQVVAGLSIHGPEVRLPESRAHAIVPDMHMAADAIGELLTASGSAAPRFAAS